MNYPGVGKPASNAGKRLIDSTQKNHCKTVLRQQKLAQIIPFLHIFLLLKTWGDLNVGKIPRHSRWIWMPVM